MQQNQNQECFYTEKTFRKEKEIGINVNSMLKLKKYNLGVYGMGLLGILGILFLFVVSYAITMYFVFEKDE